MKWAQSVARRLLSVACVTILYTWNVVQDWKVSCLAAFQQTEVCLSPEDYFQDHFTFEWVCTQHETKYTQAVHNKSACYEALRFNA
jgi:hypothetical protein